MTNAGNGSIKPFRADGRRKITLGMVLHGQSPLLEGAIKQDPSKHRPFVPILISNF